MSGASKAHATIVGNVASALRAARQRGCESFTNDVKLLTPARTVRYPDLLVTCDERDRNDPYVVRHPTLLVEVLSPSTLRVDRVEKHDEYLQIPELLEYIMIDSSRKSVEIIRRDLVAGSWILRTLTEGSALLAALDLAVALDAIYEGVDLERVY
jgi:Uma2 family endonuclease